MGYILSLFCSQYMENGLSLVKWFSRFHNRSKCFLQHLCGSVSCTGTLGHVGSRGPGSNHRPSNKWTTALHPEPPLACLPGRYTRLQCESISAVSGMDAERTEAKRILGTKCLSTAGGLLPPLHFSCRLHMCACVCVCVIVCVCVLAAAVPHWEVVGG